MKKTFIILFVLAGLLSCTEMSVEPQDPASDTPISFNVSVLETKAAITDWVSGDKIYVFFNGLETKYLVLTYDSDANPKWTAASAGGTLTVGDFSTLGTHTLTAVHFPKGAGVTVNYANGKFSFTNGGKPVYTYYLFDSGKSYTIDGATISATLAMEKPANMTLFHIAGIQANVAAFTFGCSKIKPVACKSVETDGAITEDVLQAGARLSGFVDSDGSVFAGRLVHPGVAKDYKFTLTDDAYIYTITRTEKTLTAGNMYNFPALTETGEGKWSKVAVSDLYVDLGLTGLAVGGNTVYWAKCNLGATSETDYGDYFAWGETTGYYEGKTLFDNNYSDYYFGAGPYTKYTGSDYTLLQKEDDAAYAALGGRFRMPTKSEFEALLNSSTIVKDWVTNYKGSGVDGYTFTGNGNTIFLPAAGRRYSDGLHFTDHGSSYNGYYWSNVLVTTFTSAAEALHFNSTTTEVEQFLRSDGYSIRPVYVTTP